MVTVELVLALAAFVLTLLAALNPPRVPLWVAVLLLIVADLVRILTPADNRVDTGRRARRRGPWRGDRRPRRGLRTRRRAARLRAS